MTKARVIDPTTDITSESQPLQVFDQWMAQAKDDARVREPTAMTLATAHPSTGVHARIVLCKQWSEDGFVFYTNYESQKGQDLEAHHQAGAVFFWDPIYRQVKIAGGVEKTSRAESEAYWNSRAHDSQLSQWISKQSRAVSSRDELERLYQDAQTKFAGKAIPCPEHWGGYRLQPKTIEFWIGRPNRLHDRHLFEKANSTWTYCRLYP